MAILAWGRAGTFAKIRSIMHVADLSVATGQRLILRDEQAKRRRAKQGKKRKRIQTTTADGVVAHACAKKSKVASTSWPCNKCDEEGFAGDDFANFKQLQEHYASAHAMIFNKPWRCDLCPTHKGFVQETGLINHSKKKHQRVLTKSSAPEVWGARFYTGTVAASSVCSSSSTQQDSTLSSLPSTISTPAAPSPPAASAPTSPHHSPAQGISAPDDPQLTTSNFTTPPRVTSKPAKPIWHCPTPGCQKQLQLSSRKRVVAHRNSCPFVRPALGNLTNN
jgi:hypothetical protein